MKELRETMTVFALVICVGAALFCVSTLAGLLMFGGDPILFWHLVKLLFVGILLVGTCLAAMYILLDEVWDRKNLTRQELNKAFNLR